MKAIVAIGSNIQPGIHVPAAAGKLVVKFPGARFTEFILTEPIGRPEQGPYWNGLVEFETGLNREDVATILHGFENEAGRIRTSDKWAARELDLDVVAWGEDIDSDLVERDFLQALHGRLQGKPLGQWQVVWRAQH